MRPALAAVVLLLGSAPRSGAHRLDEYLQATTIAVEKAAIRADIRLTPGVAVFPAVLADMDKDGDGLLSERERKAYAERLRRDLSLTLDGTPLPLRLVSAKFAEPAEMAQGRGEIQLQFEAEAPRGGVNRRLVFENHHHPTMAAYLVNCLVPRDTDLRIIAQKRNYAQSSYQLDYAQAGVAAGTLPFAGWGDARGWLAIGTLLLAIRLGCLWFQRGDVQRTNL